jgi:hypothetical protein
MKSRELVVLEDGLLPLLSQDLWERRKLVWALIQVSLVIHDKFVWMVR